MPHPELVAGIERAIGESVASIDPVAGGDINEAFRVHSASGQRYFAKHRASAPPDFFAREAAGLQWLREGDSLRIPRVLATEDSRCSFLLLEWIEPSGPSRAAEAKLGEGLARLHASLPPETEAGSPVDGYIGIYPQPGRASSSGNWMDFWRDARIGWIVERLAREGKIPQAMSDRIDGLLDRLDQFDCEEAPARLHGDLWSGNALYAAGDEPVLIDPAAYAGHREVDLAMMRLFGGFGPRVFEAYTAASPLAPGFEERIPLWQLWPLLVHVALFGGGYLGSVDRALSDLGA